MLCGAEEFRPCSAMCTINMEPNWIMFVTPLGMLRLKKVSLNWDCANANIEFSRAEGSIIMSSYVRFCIVGVFGVCVACIPPVCVAVGRNGGVCCGCRSVAVSSPVSDAIIMRLSISFLCFILIFLCDDIDSFILFLGILSSRPSSALPFY